jgi:hypothetical protein
MRSLVFLLAPLLLANIVMWWPVSVIGSLCWAVALIASPRLLPE